MGKDEVLRSSLLLVGAAVIAVGACTFSFKKMVVTYVFGVLAVAGLVVPDWEFFGRDFRHWCSPMRAQNAGSSGSSDGTGPRSERPKVHPLRLALFIIIYSYGLYKWWIYISVFLGTKHERSTDLSHEQGPLETVGGGPNTLVRGRLAVSLSCFGP